MMYRYLRKAFVLMVALAGLGSASIAQQNSADDLIAASQTGGSATFFKATAADIKRIQPGTYNNPAETNVRKGLPYFFAKASEGNDLKVAYIGGSITRTNSQYRNQSFGYLQSMYPDVTMVGINAGISGSDADLGACRLYDHVLKYDPDLIFIEFAVNGGFPQGMEGMVRQIIQHNDQTDICFIYTLMSDQFKYYQNNGMPPIVEKLEEIVAHYNIPSIHMGMEATELVQEGKMVAKGDPKVEKLPAFSRDGVHPLVEGGDLYAASMARSMHRMKNASSKVSYKLPDPIYSDNWGNATMIAPEDVIFSEGWQRVDPAGTHLKGYKSWFPYIMTSEKSGESFTFKYRGGAFGVFDVGAPETGQMDVYVNGKQVKLTPVKNDRLYVIDSVASAEPIARFNSHCNNRTRGQYFFVQTPEGGEYTVTFKISGTMPNKRKILASKPEDITKNPEKYNHNRIYIGKILLQGELLR